MIDGVGKRNKDTHTLPPTYRVIIRSHYTNVSTAEPRMSILSVPFAPHWNNVPSLLGDMFSVSGLVSGLYMGKAARQ